MYRAWARIALGQRTVALTYANMSLRQARLIDHALTQTRIIAVSGLVPEILYKQAEATIYAMISVAVANQDPYLCWRAWSKVIHAGLKLKRQPATTSQDIISAGQAYRALGASQPLGYVYRKSASATLHVEEIDNEIEYAQRGSRHCQRADIAIDFAKLRLSVADFYGRRQHRRARARHLVRALANGKGMRMKSLTERVTQAMHRLH